VWILATSAGVAIALITNYLADYRLPLYERLARRHGVEVLCYGGGERYVPPWFSDLDAQLARATFPAQRLQGLASALRIGHDYEAVIAPFAGGAMLPVAYAGARAARTPFVLWASVWAQPRSGAHLLALPATRHIYRHADAIVAYGEHVRRFLAGVRGDRGDVFIAPQSVEPELFGQSVAAAQIARFRAEHSLPEGPLVLYVGRLVPEKGVAVLLEAFGRLSDHATLVLIGDGPLAARARRVPGARVLAPMARSALVVAYAAAQVCVLASVPTARFREPWGLVLNEAMHQSRAVIASDAVGAAAGGLVRDGVTGLVVRAGDPDALTAAIRRLLSDQPLSRRLGQAGREAVGTYTYDAMVRAFDLALARAARPTRRSLPE
jgi:glycosyltransferase involved in cell wall biosynthesis